MLTKAKHLQNGSSSSGNTGSVEEDTGLSKAAQPESHLSIMSISLEFLTHISWSWVWRIQKPAWPWLTEQASKMEKKQDVWGRNKLKGGWNYRWREKRLAHAEWKLIAQDSSPLTHPCSLSASLWDSWYSWSLLITSRSFFCWTCLLLKASCSVKCGAVLCLTNPHRLN